MNKKGGLFEGDNCRDDSVRNICSSVADVDVLAFRAQVEHSWLAVGYRKPMFDKLMNADPRSIDDVVAMWSELSMPPKLLNCLVEELQFNHIERHIEREAEHHRKARA